jgi:hypothetical protein
MAADSAGLVRWYNLDLFAAGLSAGVFPLVFPLVLSAGTL